MSNISGTRAADHTQRPLSQIKAVVFDTFGTVVDWRTGIAREAAPFIARHVLGVAPEAFADDWRRRYQPAMEPIRAGQRPYVPLDTLHRENLADLLAELAPGATWPEEELSELTRAWHRLDPWPDAIAGLARLKQRTIIGPLSNGNIALLVNMAKRAGLPWDVILGSDISRAYKPHPTAYTATAAALGIAPAECMLVAAHNADLAAARRAGLATGFVARPREHGPQQTIDLAPSDDWEVVASDFVDLAERLGC
jgi:2-haloacid dehalogenase